MFLILLMLKTIKVIGELVILLRKMLILNFLRLGLMVGVLSMISIIGFHRQS
jgi:hypothetical protein